MAMLTGKRKRLRQIIKYICLLALLIFALRITGVSVAVLSKRGYRFFTFISSMFPVDLAFSKNVAAPLIDTVRMSVAGTVIGSFLGLFTAFASSENVIHRKIITVPMKLITQCVRTIPVLIVALMCTFVFGIGTFAGTVALIIYTWAVMTRIGSEDIESTSLGTYNALINAGCTSAKAFVRTVLVSILPGYINNALYLLETNVRHASILGYVGAGGIGLLLNEKIAWRDYAKVGTILVMLYGAVVIIELISEFFRAYLEGRIRHTTIKNRIIACVAVVVLAGSALSIGSPNVTALGAGVMKSMVSGIIHLDGSYLFNFSKDGVPYLLFETVCIAFAGTVLGAAIAFVLSFLNSTSLMPKVIAVPVRLFIMAIRTVPVFIYGLMFIRVTGPGSFAGVLTLMMCSVGLMCKRFTVAIDNLDKAAWKAYKANGTGWIARVKYCVMPQIMPAFKSAFYYRLDVNLRDASVLGLVGAGGIGAPLIMYMNNYRWDAVGAILVGLLILVLILERISVVARK